MKALYKYPKNLEIQQETTDDCTFCSALHMDPILAPNRERRHSFFTKETPDVSENILFTNMHLADGTLLDDMKNVLPGIDTLHQQSVQTCRWF